MRTPTCADVRSFLAKYGITGTRAAQMAYLHGSSQVRKYTGGSKPHKMSGAIWFALHAHTLLSDEQIAEIEESMNSAAED